MSKEKNLYWSDKDYENAIKELKAIAESDIKVYGYDDTTTGNKSTECNHGLCSDSVKPLDAVYRKDEHKCPLDTREVITPRGCFWECAYFQKNAERMKNNPPIKEMVKSFQIK